MVSDGELLSRWRSGESDAFPELYRRHAAGLYTYLLSLVGDQEVAADLLQDTFLTLVRKARRIMRELRGRSLGTYLAVVARNRAIDWLRRQKREESLRHRIRTVRLLQGGSPAAAISSEEAAELLLSLPAGQREVLVLRFYAGLTFNDIARVLGCPRNTAVSRYRYGLQKLKAALGKATGRGGTL